MPRFPLPDAPTLSRSQRAVLAAYNQLKQDFEVSECDRAAMAAQCIGLPMKGAQQSLNTDNTGALVACIAQIDRLVGLSQAERVEQP